MNTTPRSFADYKEDGYLWITLAKGEYYPDYLIDASNLYKPVQEMFGQLVRSSASSEQLFLDIQMIPEQAMRVQLSRVFRKYVSPEIPVEMTKVKSKAGVIIERFGAGFRMIQEVQKAYMSRPIPDETLAALLWEYKDRGKKGYNLTEQFFRVLRSQFSDLPVEGPERAGADISMGKVFQDYPNPKRPVDFIIYGSSATSDEKPVLAIGLARYDSDRGGAQEDDRIGGYRHCADEILTYAKANNLKTKVIFLNDGPGLLLGTMWNDYAKLEESWPGKILVLTLRMVPARLTLDWLYS